METSADKDQKYSTIHYQEYLKLDAILGAQNLRSKELENPAHDEMLFIVIHQVYELWFKQIIHELGSVQTLFRKDQVDERNIGVAVSRLNRVEEILKLLVNQIKVMETMTPLDFLDFRSYLFPASGFQSFQFRAVECLLGLPENQRLTYHGQKYSSVFPSEQQKQLDQIYEKGTLFDMVQKWLERIPFIKFQEFDFLEKYSEAVNDMLEEETAAIYASTHLSSEEKKMRAEMVGSTDTYFRSILNKESHQRLVEEGKIRFSYEATIAALFINLYRDEPILHMPFRFLTALIEIDDLFTTWRYRHAQMVMRMLGNKIGTGGSSGHAYLSKTAQSHQIFKDLHQVSTLLIPRSSLPALPRQLKDQLSFHFTVS